MQKVTPNRIHTETQTQHWGNPNPTALMLYNEFHSLLTLFEFIRLSHLLYQCQSLVATSSSFKSFGRTQ